MADLMDMVASQIDAGTLAKLANAVGGNQAGTQNAIESALPMLIAAMNKNASQSRQGAEALGQAIQRDHDGSILDHVGSFLDRGPSASDNRIVDHLLGSKRQNVEQRIGQSSGLSTGAVAQLMATLAPLVMGAAGKQMSQQSGGLGGLVDMLGSATQSVQKQPGAGVLGSLLDGDGDGDVDLGDLTKLGGGLLSRFLR